MAQTLSHHHPIHLLRCLPLLLVLFHASTAMPPTNESFTLELIHRYSERSPFYNGNLTESQLLQRLVEQSISHAQWLKSTNLGATITTLRPPLLEKELLYMVKVSIGTSGRTWFARIKTYYLQLDTGSSLTWIQCNPCNPCFPQPSPIFDPTKSPTYHPLPRDHRLCTPPFMSELSDRNRNCAYDVEYYDGAYTRGVLSVDTFTFKSDRRGRDEVVPSLAFGCSHASNMGPDAGNYDGIFGMGYQSVSLLKQLLDRTGGRFSYCLVKPGSRGAGSLRFGNDFTMRGAIQRTPIHPDAEHGSYYLILNGVSVGDRRLHLPPDTFARNGGCIIDTGSTISLLIKPAYDEVTNELVRYFNTLQLRRINGRAQGMPLDLCYLMPNNYQSVLPHMSLHFQDADYHMGWEKLFLFNRKKKFFCLAMLSSDEHTILGAHQQYNIRFAYDIGRNVLSFAPENCEQDARP